MIAEMRIAKWPAWSPLGMASRIRASLIVASYEIQFRCQKLTFDTQRPFCADQFLWGLGVRYLTAAWRRIGFVLDLLFDASADVGEWFVGILSLARQEVRSPRRSSNC
jgi:hypothetical protein